MKLLALLVLLFVAACNPPRSPYAPPEPPQPVSRSVGGAAVDGDSVDGVFISFIALFVVFFIIGYGDKK